MARLPDAFIDDMLSRMEIVDVVHERYPLKRQGKEYVACCPFHDERTPSFTVSPAKQFYHCFGCGAHGSAIRFLMEYDRIGFLDAVEELAKRAGVEVPKEARQHSVESEQAPLYAVLAQAAAFYQAHLRESPEATAYLASRGLSEESIQEFGIGCAPNEFTALLAKLGTGPAEQAALERAGLVSRNDRGQAYDKFRNRIMFPIQDRRGRVVGFGGRVLEEGGGPKYLNSPETELFHKGKELYGIWQARQAPKLAKVIVVEGYLDAIALHQAGLEGAVATLGTATSAHHAETLFRTAPDVVFCFDGDKAGRAAAWRALEAALPGMRDGRQAWFVFLPEGEDPDSLVRARGRAGFEALLEQAEPLSAFFFRELSQEADLSTIDGRARLAERAKPLLAKIPDGVYLDLMQKKLGEVTGLAQRPAARSPRRGGRPKAPAVQPSLVRTVIALLLQQPALGLRIEAPYRFMQLRVPGIDLLVEILSHIHVRPEISVRALLEAFEGREEAQHLNRLAAVEPPGSEETWAGEFMDAIEQLNRRAMQQRITDLNAKRGEGELTPKEKQELLELLQERIAR